METIAADCAALLRCLPAETAALLAWPLAAGPFVAARTRAESCRGGTLAVAVLDAAWGPEIERLLPDLLCGLAALVPVGAVRRVALRPGGRA